MKKDHNHYQWAAIFDWDGVLVDSVKQHEKSWRMLAAEQHKEVAQDFMNKTFGMKNEKIISEFLGWTQNPEEITQLSKRKEELYKKIVQEEGLCLIDGVKEFLDRLKQKHIPMAVCSSTTKTNIFFVLEKLGLKEYFPVIVGAEEVREGKPHPAPYLVTAQKLGYVPSRCVVFEDAPAGVESAKKAGMKVIALTTTRPKNSLEHADLVISSWKDLSLETIDVLFNDVSQQ
ncbi:phosphatase [Methylacidiphilum kamchatkense Kam1]|uniref:HAD superfamily hydrolase (TIGR01509 family)/beta-phosphoglucomutase family hydrolase n=1 Tax=Methylacidiphilum kamchatkense Kam1 TaxID=1202785 RepID=A0A0C1V4F1_9BACT|nr:HAD family phosphatase [Methylacidiphilum kamchatkense]KIE58595.1 phosphatase [Methylacidiphilum kamchatkense Kam1]QDQ41320.1 HAD superfamily hydrolase (TIGR01509 family)/beta-phosphoglucomutase family hydrolase [Methylacidiphilum kamchatkense Kam1]